MTTENPNEPMMVNEQPMSAWAAAAAQGVDMSLIEYSLSLPPEQRIRFHDSRLRLYLLLEARAGFLEAPVKSS